MLGAEEDAELLVHLLLRGLVLHLGRRKLGFAAPTPWEEAAKRIANDSHMLIHTQMYVWMDGWMYGHMDGWMDVCMYAMQAGR